MKLLKTLLLAATALWTASCTQVAPVGNVEGLERQAPVTQDPNALGDAINAQNAANYSNGRSYGYGYGRGRYGY